MTLVERLADAHARSVTAYLRRQDLEQQRQAITLACGRTDQELLTLDGEIAVLTALIAEVPPG